MKDTGNQQDLEMHRRTSDDSKMKNETAPRQALTWDAICYLYGGIWIVTLPDGKEVELNCNGGRGVGFRAINCFGFNVAQKATYTRKSL